jgi:hypothetical protein
VKDVALAATACAASRATTTRFCCKHLRADWRMFTAYLDDDHIVIVAIDRHTPRNNPAAVLAAVLPDLATVGRRRDDKPPCCDDPAEPPEMSDELRALLDGLL